MLVSMTIPLTDRRDADCLKPLDKRAEVCLFSPAWVELMSPDSQVGGSGDGFCAQILCCDLFSCELNYT